MKEQIRKTLNKVGYFEADPTEEDLKECFLDYVADGYFGNLTYEEAIQEIDDGDITLSDMIKNLSYK